MHQRWILVIADDLTGALEAGSKFAAHGLPATITSVPDMAVVGGPVVVTNSDTRHSGPAEAARKISMLLETARQHKPWLIYKKTDSTLRGNIGPEIGAILSAFPDRDVLYVPAYPAMGRTVRHGELLVDGVPVNRTAFAADSLNPIYESSVQATLGGVPATILDGETDEDIRAAAQHIAGSGTPPIVAGPAAIAGALAECVPMERTPPRRPPKIRRCVVVNGSMHPTSAAQIEYARERSVFDADWTLLEYDGEDAGVERARSVGSRVAQFLRDNPVDAIIIFGGDTAYGIHQALGGHDILSCSEALPGVPVSRIGTLHLVTKAGGFGKRNLLEELRKQLT